MALKLTLSVNLNCKHSSFKFLTPGTLDPLSHFVHILCLGWHLEFPAINYFSIPPNFPFQLKLCWVVSNTLGRKIPRSLLQTQSQRRKPTTPEVLPGGRGSTHAAPKWRHPCCACPLPCPSNPVPSQIRAFTNFCAPGRCHGCREGSAEASQPPTFCTLPYGQHPCQATEGMQLDH